MDFDLVLRRPIETAAVTGEVGPGTKMSGNRSRAKSQHIGCFAESEESVLACGGLHLRSVSVQDAQLYTVRRLCTRKQIDLVEVRPSPNGSNLLNPRPLSLGAVGFAGDVLIILNLYFCARGLPFCGNSGFSFVYRRETVRRFNLNSRAMRLRL